MKVVAEATARGSVQTVWDALHDAATLGRAIPGCEQFEVSGPGLGEFTATAEIPAIRGTYAGKLTVTEQQRPSMLKLTASATGEQGTVSADVTLTLSDAAGQTLISYEANGAVTGSIAGVGTRLLTGAAKRLADEFFAVIDESVTEHPATPPSDAAVMEPDAAKPASAASDADRPGAVARPGPAADSRVALVAGVAIGLAGVVIGVLAGRRGRRAGRVRA